MEHVGWNDHSFHIVLFPYLLLLPEKAALALLLVQLWCHLSDLSACCRISAVHVVAVHRPATGGSTEDQAAPQRATWGVERKAEWEKVVFLCMLICTMQRDIDAFSSAPGLNCSLLLRWVSLWILPWMFSNVRWRRQRTDEWSPQGALTLAPLSTGANFTSALKKQKKPQLECF